MRSSTDDFSETMRIPEGSSLFTAEAKAIDLELDLVADCETSNKFVIFSDSLSVLKSLDNTSHIGIASNENVDQKAKDFLYLHPTNFLLQTSYIH